MAVSLLRSKFTLPNRLAPTPLELHDAMPIFEAPISHAE